MDRAEGNEPAGAVSAPAAPFAPAAPSVTPFGEWPSPITAAGVARGAIKLSFPSVRGGQVWWQESKPDEGGRTAVVHRAADGRRRTLPAPWNARTRVHEYGGLSYLP